MSENKSKAFDSSRNDDFTSRRFETDKSGLVPTDKEKINKIVDLADSKLNENLTSKFAPKSYVDRMRDIRGIVASLDSMVQSDLVDDSRCLEIASQYGPKSEFIQQVPIDCGTNPVSFCGSAGGGKLNDKNDLRGYNTFVGTKKEVENRFLRKKVELKEDSKDFIVDRASYIGSLENLLDKQLELQYSMMEERKKEIEIQQELVRETRKVFEREKKEFRESLSLNNV